MLLITMLKVVVEAMLKYVEVNIIHVRLRLMMNKVFYLVLSLMMIVRMLVKMTVMMMTMVVIMMMNKISHKLL